MAHFVGLDVSVKKTSVCVVDAADRVILEQKVPTEPADIIALLTSLGVTFGRIGIEAGPLSQWLVNALTAVDLPVICVETRHMKALLTAQQISKTDRNDARGIAQMMRVGLFKPVHVKTLVAQEQRMLLTSRKLLQRKLLDVESDLRGTLRNFGLKVGVVSNFRFEGRVRELVGGFPRLAAIVEWFSVNDEEQEKRFQDRMRNPIKRWKLSAMDIEFRRHWVDYSQAKDLMFARTDTKMSPWYLPR